jgi:hypothetical protein
MASHRQVQIQMKELQHLLGRSVLHSSVIHKDKTVFVVWYQLGLQWETSQLMVLYAKLPVQSACYTLRLASTSK